jgi:hypothetical protein
MKNTPRSGQNQAVVPLAWGFLIIWIPAFAGTTQFFSNELSGINPLSPMFNAAKPFYVDPIYEPPS